MRASIFDARILVIEPGAFMARTLRSMLADLGFSNQEHFDDAQMALSALKATRADIILCDAASRPLDGPSFARAVRQGRMVRDPYVPILITAFGTSRSLVEEARDAGATEVLAKPLASRTLVQKIAASLERPRPFVRCPSYNGPDRRRRDDTPPGDDRRVSAPLARRRVSREAIGGSRRAG